MDKDITLKEVFERLVTLEAKFDLQAERNTHDVQRFWTFTIGIIAMEIVNLVLNFVLIFYFKNK